MVAMPLMAQTYNVPFNPRVVVGGGCAGVADLSSVLLGLTWKNATCSGTLIKAYTLELDKGDFPDALALDYVDPTTGTDEAALHNADVWIAGGTCTLDIDYDSTAGGSDRGGFGSASTSWTRPQAEGCIYIEMHHDEGVDDDLSSGATVPNMLRLGAGNNSVFIRVGGDDLTAVVDDGAGANNDVTTAGDTGSGCCGGGGCDDLFLPSGYVDTQNKGMSVEVCYHSNTGTDFSKLYIDGCLVDTSETPMTTMSMSTSEQLYVGMAQTGDAGDFRIGRVFYWKQLCDPIVI